VSPIASGAPFGAIAVFCIIESSLVGRSAA
jgi:hypothetical protein